MPPPPQCDQSVTAFPTSMSDILKIACVRLTAASEVTHHTLRI
ncbi:hypothetical protein EGR_09451 [Echinococcus granulosus]|uniref:Uncharacterized protein n=1 Tax=Echinococcus granulosus TaxID=6210 RepID=W6U564_ECHGR|nr:hypothetical protein EGR_09451 [Echinococcus granulosus]EUB55691.1 hypothetical protein EGR_09451 [Echinococcus granulosus]